MQTSKCSVNGGSSISGYCIGESDLQCCVTGSSTTKSYGVDVSSAVGSSTASCLASSTFNSFIIPRGYKSSGSVDTNVCTTLNNAKTAGISRRDVYMFPNAASTTVSAASQLATLVSYLKSTCSSAWSGFVWLDIEGTQYWTGSTSSNQAFLQSLVDSCVSTLGSSKCGVYSSYYQVPTTHLTHLLLTHSLTHSLSGQVYLVLHHIHTPKLLHYHYGMLTMTMMLHSQTFQHSVVGANHLSSNMQVTPQPVPSQLT
jgi:hypothetical protein